MIKYFIQNYVIMQTFSVYFA